MKSLTLGVLILLCAQNAFSKSVPPEDVLIYSTSAKALITRVYSEDNKFLWFESCDLIADKQGIFEGFSAKNCSKISMYDVINTNVYIEALSIYFTRNLEKEIENSRFIYEEGFFVAAIISATLSGGKVFDLKKSVRSKAANPFAKAAQATVLIVATGYFAAKSAIVGIEPPPSIETNLLNHVGENSSVENNLSIHINSSTPEEVMELIKCSLEDTLEDVGIVRNI